ncbi:YgiW/YdeI family stress tolerance OB fold protein [Serratia plymuthica]|uniref:Uncharacterized conserved protein n=1 Tax=Serratia plymuthica TaxID=82996 RepID=A0A2X4UWT3_SERPL|nr:YgiW/YdeI family stress tolerance OB fold protein [Serratia plymuthica]QPS19731.1 YgiW/YdeI family stress tolerance OB fold protein [Serratia plymuthica]QPS61443.1 YgiW/YdeI family stress tolerance OB fold protein [Serratia plymuthica]RKS61482.1 uncharacterized protein (TIGR00156 family) [Serratia plymuthica]CAI2465428.1 Uncharacterized conserved protein [Serratia plymuthica]SQI44316.1 Uncharacterized conserved protein [Serratia plymuthica]
MKKYTLAALIALCSAPVLAQQGGFLDPSAPQTQTAPQGGFSGPSAALTTVDKVKSMSDDIWVMLQGNIEQRVGDDTYTFRDASGTLTVEIDKKRWNGQTITPKDKVQLEGKVDKDWSSVEVDVKNIKKLPQRSATGGEGSPPY